MAAKVETNKPGFASMDPERLKEIGRRGGQRAHQLGKGHTFTPEEAREAGKKGDLAISRKGVNARRRRAEARDLTGKEA